MEFQLVSEYQPAGDQPHAIANLVQGVKAGSQYQTLLGVTGSGKTFTMANLIAQLRRPTLIIAHNKTLAAQLYEEMKSFFPHNAVEYFVSYYDYYQPEAYLPGSDTYIEKDAAINEKIESLRLAATKAILERRDVVIIASVSAIYGLGDPKEYAQMILFVKRDEHLALNDLARRLTDLQYRRNDFNFARGNFRVRGDSLDIYLIEEENLGLRFTWWDDIVEEIYYFDPLTGKKIRDVTTVRIFPKTHYVASKEALQRAIVTIRTELTERLAFLRAHDYLLEAERLKQRTEYDLEMLKELGYCNGIENYSRHFSQRQAGEPPPTLLDYFPEDALLIIDESHVTLPQLHSMYNGDQARKQSLVRYGFRLPSALDNRPLKFSEFEQLAGQTIYVSATPGEHELTVSEQIVELVIRPTGLVDPVVTVRPVQHQVDDLFSEITQRVKKHERVLALTLTKKMAEDLSNYLTELGIKVKYLHSEIHTMERVEILRDFRLGEFDVLVGINLLREGLDLPEISLVAILDADKEGFLRSTSSLIQISGRAARNVNGQVIMYADKITGSMQRALHEMQRRRQLQLAYNQEHHIVPKTITKAVKDLFTEEITERTVPAVTLTASKIRQLQAEMYRLAENLEFEKAAKIRDQLAKIKLSV